MGVINEQIIDGQTVPELNLVESINGGIHQSNYDYLWVINHRITYVFDGTTFRAVIASPISDQTYFENVYRYYPTDYGTNPRVNNVSYTYTYNGKTVYYTDITKSPIVTRSNDLPLLPDINQNKVFSSGLYSRIAWAMIYGDVTPDGYGITYDLIHATGLPTNPTVQVPGVFPSLAYFLPDENYSLTNNSVTITYGAPDYDPFDDFEFDPVGGGLTIGELSGEIIVTVRARPNPYEGGGTSETGGGEGTYGDDRFGDGIDDESIETPDYDPLDQFDRSVLGSQFVNVYAPTRSELQSLKNYLWSSTIGDTLKKMFNNPMDSIVTLHMVPVTVPTSAGSIFLGGTDTEIGSNRVTNQYVTVNCGSMSIGEYWDAYLDYSPYTKMFLYLPFCGMHEIDVDEFMGQTITIRYDVDVVSGDCLASVSATRSGGLSTVLYQYAGNCSVEIPVSMANYNARVAAYLGLVGSAAGVVAGVASGGMSAPLAATALASSAANIATAKKTVQRSGAIAGSTAWMSQLKPYFILVQPSQCLPDNQAHFTGYPSFITAAVGDLSGYTEFAEIHLEGISATDSEKAEIEAILKGGVLI